MKLVKMCKGFGLLRSHDTIHGVCTPSDQWADGPSQSPDPASGDDGDGTVCVQ